MPEVFVVSVPDWESPIPDVIQEQAINALEAGHVVFFPRLRFAFHDDERCLLAASAAGEAKNISLDASGENVRGASVDGDDAVHMRNAMRRFADASDRLLRRLLPRYASDLERARTSYRPLEIAGRRTSWRKDDTRLHVDSFPSSPLQGRRILRVFSNVNPEDKGRTWRLGEPFEQIATRFGPGIRGPLWGAGPLLSSLSITKGRRSAYDHFMLALHDRMKADLAYQAQVAQSTYVFPAGSTWIAFTDQVAHAATGGQFAFEQTFHIPVRCMKDPERSPLRVLERVLSRTLT